MYEKTGIIKEGIPVVLGNDMPLRIAMREAKKRNSSHYVVYPDDPHNFTFDHLNAKVTRKVLSLLLHKYPLLTEEAIARGVKARLRSRLEEATPQILQLLALKWGLTKLPYKVFHEFKTNIGSLVCTVYIYTIYIYILYIYCIYILYILTHTLDKDIQRITSRISKS